MCLCACFVSVWSHCYLHFWMLYWLFFWAFVGIVGLQCCGLVVLRHGKTVADGPMWDRFVSSAPQCTGSCDRIVVSYHWNCTLALLVRGLRPWIGTESNAQPYNILLERPAKT